MSLGQTPEPPAEAPVADAEKRLQWLKSRVPPKPAPTPRPAVAPKVGFRTSPQAVSPRQIDPQPAEPIPAKPSPAEPAPAKSRTAKATPTPPVKATPPAVVAEATPAKKRPPEGRTAKATPSPAKTTPAPIAKAPPPPPDSTPAPIAAEFSSKKKGSTESRAAAAKATPTPLAEAAPTPPIKMGPTPKAKPTELAKLTPPTTITPPGKTAKPEARATPSPKLTQAPALAFIPPNVPTPKPQPPEAPVVPPSKGRYPWKTNIVTTVFWVGEPPGGNNPTPNRSSSWDANWTRNYGGFDNPDPAARRNFLPARFTPRQNPFYVALPYNDVTRGTTKPEARRVIPWFREAFRKNGQSVCRDRWVAIRSQSGKVAYAQWSDCGPFRTDHWQYVFDKERPKLNLNKGAGLDVSPAVRDFLGLDGTDHTDWKFVDFRDVPTGPWARYGSNNTFVQKDARPAKSKR